VVFKKIKWINVNEKDTLNKLKKKSIIVIKALGIHNISPMFILSHTHTNKKEEERKDECCATSPSGDTTVLSRKELREPTIKNLFS
jgi:hypothetical protein